MMKALDLSEDPTGHGMELLDLGVEAILAYPRLDRISHATVDNFRTIGIKFGWVFERGEPTSVEYFTSAQGSTDAQEFLTVAPQLGISPDDWIFAAVDYDASVDDLEAIGGYFDSAKLVVKAAGYHFAWDGSYGSKRVLNYLMSTGRVQKTWLAQSPGWSSDVSLKTPASIIQSLTTAPLGLNGDWDSISDVSIVR